MTRTHARTHIHEFWLLWFEMNMEVMLKKRVVLSVMSSMQTKVVGGEGLGRRTMFVDETVHTRATGSTIEPQNNRILPCLSFGLNKVVEQLLSTIIIFIFIINIGNISTIPT